MLRILRITNRQMQSWERTGLLVAAETYSFFDLLQIKKLSQLRAKGVRSEAILKSLEDLRLASGMTNPLVEAGLMNAGKRLAFRHHGRAVEITGQFRFDFTAAQPAVAIADRSTARTVTATPAGDSIPELFARGVALEENPATQAQAVECYRKVLAMEPRHAAAHINLGTIYYNRQDFAKAEQHYRQAIEADPRYALAYFDLGNVLDETGRLPEAVRAYQTAIMLAPTYADAHYNVALAFEKVGHPRKALLHWRAYAKLDHTGPWAAHARQQITKVLHDERLRIVWRKASPTPSET